MTPICKKGDFINVPTNRSSKNRYKVENAIEGSRIRCEVHSGVSPFIIIPYALVQYYPLLFVLGRTDNVIFMVIPLCAVLFLVPCYVLWRFGVRHYTSSGS